MSTNNGQNGNQKRGLTGPKGEAIEKAKKAFIEELKKNGGIATKAMDTSGLKRQAAYDHFKNDPEFADAWLHAIEFAHDELMAVALKRATVGEKVVVKDAKGKVHNHFQKSDTLLIFLLKQGEAQKKWRARIIQTGNLALGIVQERGSVIGLNQKQIEDLQLAMTEKFKGVSLV